MRNNKKIPTIIGLIVLVAGAIAGVYLTQATTVFRLKASAEKTPNNIKTSNVSNNSFSVSWTTDEPATASLVWGESTNLGQTQVQIASELKQIHYITLADLKPDTVYYFKINSGGAEYDNAGIPWQVKTSSEQSGTNSGVISGELVDPANNPVANAIIYATDENLTTLSALTSENGSWVIAYSGLATNPLLQILALATNQEVSSAQIYLESANPVPPMTLGQSYDFKNLDATQQNEIPKSSVDVPAEEVHLSQPQSKIQLPEISTPTATATVTIDNIEQDEVLTTTQPQFSGDGPAGTTITITVHSEEQIADSLVVGPTGDWSWIVPEGLSPGDHTITISWTDAAGILRQLTRNFVVEVTAAESPVATASASPTSSPTISPSPKPSATTSPTATPAIPVSGSLTLTLAVSIIGIVLLSFSIWTLIRQPNQ